MKSSLAGIPRMAPCLEVNLPQIDGFWQALGRTRRVDVPAGRRMPRRAPKNITIAIIETPLSTSAVRTATRRA